LYLGGGAPQDIEAVLTAAQVVALQAAADAVHVAPALVDYVLALVNATRTDAQVQMGLSPRAGLALLAAARAWALIDARDAVLPEDVQAVFKAVAAHRLLPTGDTLSATALAQRLLDTVAIP
jgi:MoxR-like ATPase